MSMKKTDLMKNLAKKLDGKMKSASVPERFAQGSTKAPPRSGARSGSDPARLVPVACRLPAELVNRLRERAADVDGGLNALMAQAVERWLASDPDLPRGTEP